ncbi:MAG: LptA/OstA family protein [Alphaproteobacteria bacterium]|nr:LptA/OstA family protein [Alphaproteobacteria bacterium]
MNKTSLVYSLTLAFILLLQSSSALANITLTADDRVELHQNDQKIIAVGNAQAQKDDTKIKAEKMTGTYIKDAKNKMQIERVVAEKNVRINSDTMSASGSFLDYDLNKDEMILKGNPAIIKTENGTIEAQEGIKYFPSKNVAVSVGKVKATENGNDIYADEMISYFADNNGKLEIKKIEIMKNVRIISKDVVVLADKGEYIPKENKIRLHNNVTINQNGNILKGDYAETDLETGISKLIANKNKKGRVSGVFIEKKKENK